MTASGGSGTQQEQVDGVAGRAEHYRRVAGLFDRVCDLPAPEREAALAGAAAAPAVIAEVRELLDLDADPAGPLPVSDAWDVGLSPEVEHRVRRLAAQSRSRARYERLELVAEGGMGAVHVVWDRVLGRKLAMKSLRDRRTGGLPGDDATKAVARFLEEARIAGQLDHPGIVPVHDLGIDVSGRLWFTMPLVRGRTLQDIVRAVHAGDSGWTLVRVLGILQRACEAMGYAHGKGVVHRDLKPSNIMVGRHGETYVMDWGLARLLAEPDAHDLRIAEQAASGTQRLRSGREPGEWDESPLLTLDGEVLGTPAYMAPEQARGDLDRVGPASDVYAMGCILYELLTGRMPYASDRSQRGPRAIWRAVLEGPPVAVGALAAGAPPEVVAICARAMERRMEQRYSGMQQMADDLRAYLEGRVVSAYASGALAELRKWVGRNRVAASALIALALVGTGAGFVLAWQVRGRAALLARELDAHVVSALILEAQALEAGDVPQLQEWLARAHEVLGRREQYVAELAAFDAAHPDAVREPLDHPKLQDALRGLRLRRGHFAEELALIDQQLAGAPSSEIPPEIATKADRALIFEELAGCDERVSRAEARLLQARADRYADAALERRRAPLVALVDGLAALADGPLACRGRIEHRLAELTSLRVRTIDDERAAWDAAITSIADRQQCPLYDGLVIRPQVGLVPLGRDSRSTLWEFWHVLSGDRPERGPSGELLVRPETGIVLVLVPGGTFWMGGQSTNPTAPGYVAPDPVIGIVAFPDQAPVHAVPLAPFFLDKHELTQGQWLRLTGVMPSALFAGMSSTAVGVVEPRVTRTHPVEQVSWVDCNEVLPRWGLVLPTEAQWERAARGGGDAAFGSTQRFADLLGQVNFADNTVEAFSMKRLVPLDAVDGRGIHGPVDGWGSNAFGFVAILGNVREWCLDEHQPYADAKSIDPVTGEHKVGLGNQRVERGGGYVSPPNELVVSNRQFRGARYQAYDLGVRPARALDP